MSIFTRKKPCTKELAAQLIEQVTGQPLERLLYHADSVTLSISNNESPIATVQYSADDWFGQINLITDDNDSEGMSDEE